MRALLIGLLFIGLTSLCYSQVDDGKMLSEVEVYATNYDYLQHIKSNDIHPTVSLLERKVAKFDIKSLNLEIDGYSTYQVLFFIPEGKINALYNNSNKIIRTREIFKDIKLPIHVINSISKTYPEYDIESDVYFVRYDHRKGIKKTYKITLVNKDRSIKIKSDENGNIL
ncbi:MAG: nicotinate-nucleotide adenylyltransferase [Aureibaculum sp.]|nr:nicotinate-nucleotide adenylyltransferase [Aureibaculum sp.]